YANGGIVVFRESECSRPENRRCHRFRDFETGRGGDAGVSLQKFREWLSDDRSDAQQRVLHRETRLRRGVGEHSEQRSYHGRRRLGGGPFRGLGANRRVCVGEKLSDDWI